MRCRDARQLLFHRATPEADPQLAAHLAQCSQCGALAARLLAVQQGLRRHQAEHTPDAGFSARVVARLPAPTEMLGRAALRLLPAAFVLALLCTWYTATAGPGLSELLLEPDDGQLLTYVALGGEAGR
ncbi:MAG TPA: hypothetical protein VGV61_05090 [Thermoanaerobaculia bacterium]|jgi:hypothetical protein|nr:hypothetical protein [Thermoanaerobaculia bacterium]